MKKRPAIYLGVYGIVAAAACAFTWSTHAPPPISVAVDQPPGTRVERKREVRSISVERQAALGRSLNKGTDWKKLAEKKTFGTERTEAISRAMEAGDHAAAVALVMQETNENKRAEGLRAVFKSWALADPAAALAAVNTLKDSPPYPDRPQHAAAQGYFHGLNAGPPGTVEAHLPEALKTITNDSAQHGLIDLACEHLLITGRVDGERLLRWWMETPGIKNAQQQSNGFFALAKAAMEVGELEKKGELQSSERLVIHAGLLRALDFLYGNATAKPDTAEFLVCVTGGMEDRHSTVDAYDTPKDPAMLKRYLAGAGKNLAQDSPAQVLSLLATATDDAGRAKADGLWSGYVSYRTLKQSTSDAMSEFSAPGIPIAHQQGAAEAIVKRKMQEDSILLTTLVNDLPENAVKDSYRARIADWLQQNGHKEDAAMWRESVKDQSVLENK